MQAELTLRQLDLPSDVRTVVLKRKSQQDKDSEASIYQEFAIMQEIKEQTNKNALLTHMLLFQTNVNMLINRH